MKRINVAIDGPSAAGKSTISKQIAKRMGYVHLDTGAMYRSTAYKALQKGISWNDEDRLAEMLASTNIQLTADGKVILDGVDVSYEIRQNEISKGASDVSRHEKVRKELVKRQQQMALDKGFVMDGRDIGTVVLTDAELKIYQTASASKRALRRHKENIEKGIESDLEAIEAAIIERDYQDMNREVSPLRKADDAIELDTSDLTIDEVVDKVMEMILNIVNE